MLAARFGVPKSMRSGLVGAIILVALITQGRTFEGFDDRARLPAQADEQTFDFLLVEQSGRVRANGQSFWLRGIKLPRWLVCSDRAGRRWGCGTASQVHWAQLLAGGPIHCTRLGSEDSRRICNISGKDVAEELLNDGWGIRDPDVKDETLETAERAAKDRRRGIWSLTRM